MTLPQSATLFGWARARRPARTQSYFRELAQHWQPMAKRPRDEKRAPKNYLGMHWQGMPAWPRQRAAYDLVKKG
jgi:hypothetical protein